MYIYRPRPIGATVSPYGFILSPLTSVIFHEKLSLKSVLGHLSLPGIHACSIKFLALLKWRTNYTYEGHCAEISLAEDISAIFVCVRSRCTTSRGGARFGCKNSSRTCSFVFDSFENTVLCSRTGCRIQS